MIGIGISLWNRSRPSDASWLLRTIIQIAGNPVALFAGNGIESSGEWAINWTPNTGAAYKLTAGSIEKARTSTIGSSAGVLMRQDGRYWMYTAAIPVWKTALIVTEAPNSAPAGNQSLLTSYPRSGGADAVLHLAASLTWLADANRVYYRNGIPTPTVVAGSGPAIFEASSAVNISGLCIGAWNDGTSWTKTIGPIVLLPNQLTVAQRSQITYAMRHHCKV